MAETTKLPIESSTPSRQNVPTVGAFGSFDRLRREMDRLFDDLTAGFGLPARWRSAEAEPFWRSAFPQIEPVVDWVAKPDRYEITAELPGLDEKNVEVTLSNGTLMVSGEKRDEKEEKTADYVMSERRYGTFRRSFRLPDDVDAEKIEARFKNGLLTVNLPKTEAAKKETKIDIKAA